MKSLLVLAPAAFLSLVSVHAQALPDGPGKSLVENVCGSCHGLDLVTSQTGTRATWQDTVDSMRGRGATGSDDDFKTIVDYLAKNFPAPGPAPAAAPATTPAAPATPGGLPEGPGKSLVENVCGSCHGLDLVTSQTGTRATWQDTVDSMRGRGATGSDDDFKTIVDYLAKNFPAPGAASPAPANAPAAPGAASPAPANAPAAPAAPAAKAAPATASGFPQGPGESTFENTCGGCHGADIVLGQTGTRDVWQDTIDSMRGRGATGSDADFKTIVDYLTKYFGVPVNVNQAAAKDMANNLVITPDEAAAIVKYRTANGNFKDYSDLSKVQGLDITKLDPIKSRITF